MSVLDNIPLDMFIRRLYTADHTVSGGPAMTASAGPARRFRFSDFEVDLRSGELRHNGDRIKLGERPLQILSALLERPGEVVTREEIQQRLWTADTSVDFEHSINTAILKLREALGDRAEKPRFIETLPRHGYRFICPVELGGNRDNPLVLVLEANGPQGTIEARNGARRRGTMAEPRRRFALAAGALVFVAAGLLVFNVGQLRDRARSVIRAGVEKSEIVAGSPVENLSREPQHSRRRSIAVLGFKNLSGREESAWLSTALSEMISTELAARGALRTVAGEDVARVKVSLSLADADSYSKETLARLRSNLGADLVVHGTYLALGEKRGGRIRLDLRLQDTRDGETIVAASETGTEANVFELVSQAGAHLRRQLGVGDLTAAEFDSVRASLPSNPEAARLYAEGLSKLRLFDALAARDLLEKAATVDPQHAFTHSALASAWSTLGYDSKASLEAKKAFELSSNLPREGRLEVEGHYRLLTHEPAKAVEVYRTLWGFFPDNLDYGLRLARAQATAGQAKESMATIEALRRLPRPAQDDARIDVEEGKTAEILSDSKRELAAAQRAVAKGESQGARLLVAQARALQGGAYRNLGQLEEARIALEDGKRIFAEAGDGNGVARLLNWIAVVLQDQGNLPPAKKVFHEALEAFRRTGNKRGMASVMNNLATLHEAEGQLNKAKEDYRQSLEISQEIGDKGLAAMALGNIATIYHAQGDLTAAERGYEESLRLDREIGDRRSAAVNLTNLAALADSQGNMVEAKEFAEGSLRLYREIGNKYGMAQILGNIGEIHLSLGDFSAARSKVGESLALYRELGSRTGISDDLSRLARISLEEGQFVEAEASATQAAREYSAEKASDDEASALCLLAQSHVGQQRLADAQNAIDRATTLSAKSDSREIRMAVAIAEARVRAARGLPDQATKSLAGVIAEATRFGFISYQLESRLALGEIEMKSGKTVAGRTRLEALEGEAKAKGLVLVARKAAAAREQTPRPGRTIASRG
jgi:DNA-binding winged helix-turn-helix (wHTH) protein/tetratricopeptide (TPR) repeat protein